MGVIKRVALVGLLCLAAGRVEGQDRDAKVRGDRATFEGSADWVYNDLEQGRKLARESGKPLFVVVRCIPCEACQKFDDDVARRDPIVRDLLDRYVCVRIVQANALDLTRFQFDFDQSWAAFLMDPDLMIYGRFGTRSNRRDESRDISLEGLRLALQEGLKMHCDAARLKPALAGKQVKAARHARPEDYPSLAGKYRPRLDYAEKNVAKGCLHCHQIGEAERLVYRSAAEPIPDEVLYPYPNPRVLGLELDPKAMAAVERVAEGSAAARDGLKAGDRLQTLAGQPLLSIADAQWVLHHAPATGTLDVGVVRDGKPLALTLTLREGWRHGDIAWRTTTWDLRRMAFGGMFLEDLTAEQRREAGLSDKALALRAQHVGQFGNHAVAQRAGARRGDVVVAYDGLDHRLSESDLIAHAVQRKRPGDSVAITVLREGRRRTFTIVLQ